MLYVIDSGIMMNIDSTIEIDDGDIYTTTKAMSEIKSMIAKHMLEVTAANNPIRIVDPEEKYVNQVTTRIHKMGVDKVSQVDLELIALALSLQPQDDVILISDDFGLRNVAEELKINTQGYKNVKQIKIRKYRLICEACGEKYTAIITECEVCGHTKFRRKRR